MLCDGIIYIYKPLNGEGREQLFLHLGWGKSGVGWAPFDTRVLIVKSYTTLKSQYATTSYEKPN